jgi:hypothetical protein
MNDIGSRAERVDRLVDAVLATDAPATQTSPELERFAVVASALGDALSPMPPGTAFEARLAGRLAEAAARPGAIGVLGHRGRLLVTGAAVSSAAVGVTAFAVWRATRRQPAHRFWER